MRLFSWLRPAEPAKRVGRARLGVEQLDDRIVPSTFTVQNLADSGAGSLRAAVAAANSNPGADVVVFAPAARGTITLTSGELGITDDLRIDGPGANRLAVSGNDASRVFTIGSGAEVVIEDLTVTRGRGLLRGGGIRNDGTLTLSGAVVSDNVVVGLPAATATPAVAALGGGVYNSGSLTVLRTTFARNQSLGAEGNPGGPGSAGLGGAISSFSLDGGPPASAVISYSTFIDNRAVGGAAGAGGAVGGAGNGGAIQNDNSSLTVDHTLFRGNQSVGGAGGVTGGFAAGGAITNGARFGDTTLSISHSTLVNNLAIGGAGGTTGGVGRGGGIANLVAFQAPAGSTFAATVAVDHSMLLGNRAVGGAGTTGGIGQGGGISNENGSFLTVTDSALLLNQAVGGTGEVTGGDGLGGGIFNGPPTAFGVTTVTLQRGLVALNRAAGGAGGSGSDGLGQGGGLYITPGGTASADDSAVFANDASTSDDDVFGILV